MQANIPPAPPPAPLPKGSNNFDFIMNTGQPKKGFGGSSMKQRLLLVIVGGVGLLIVAIIIFSLISGSGSNSVAKLTDIAQQQTEIARIADIGVDKATSTATKNLAHTTKLSLESSQKQTVALLAKKGKKLNAKLLGIKHNSATDDRLNAAAVNNNFDETFTKLLTDELTSYRTDLQAEYKAATSAAEKQILKDSFDGVTILLANN